MGARCLGQVLVRSFTILADSCIRPRTSLLVMLVTAMGGTWALEQPNGSCFEFFPAFQQVVLNMMTANKGPAAQTSEDILK